LKRTEISAPRSARTTGAIPVVLPDREYPIGIRYAIAIIATAVGVALTGLFAPYLTRVIFILCWPAVVASAWYGGFGPALLASLLSVLAVDYFLLPPVGVLQPLSPTDALPLALFIGVSALVSAATRRARASQYKAFEMAQRNGELAWQIEQQALELESQLEEAQSLSEELEQTSADLAERTAAAESAELFTREVLESITDPFVVIDKEWRYRWVNTPAIAVFRADRVPAGGVVGRVVWELYPELIGSDFEREMRRSVTESKPVTFEAFHPETGRWTAMFCYPLPDGGLATQWKDITARRHAEEAAIYLSRATEILSSSLDYEDTLERFAHLVVPRLADWCAVDVLDEAGARRQLAVAHVDPEKVRWARELNRRYPPDPTAVTGVPNVLRTGRPELYDEVTDEMLVASAVDEEHLRIIRQLGLRSAMIVPLRAHERTIGTLTLISAESGRRYGQPDLDLALELARRAALAVDNAEQHRLALQAQHRSEEMARSAHAAEDLLARVFTQAPLALALVRGPDHRYDIANEHYQRFIGRTVTIGSPIRDSLPEVDVQGIFARLDEVYATGRPDFATEMPVQIARGDGGEMEDVFVNSALQPIIGGDGSVTGIAVIIVDVTQLVVARKDAERLRASAEAANATKTAFLTSMSHELRTPLNAIAGYAELLTMGLRGPTTREQRDDLERIQRSQRHLLGLINDILNFARIEAGRVEYAIQPVPLNELVLETQSLVRPQLAARSLAFSCELPPYEVVALADGEKVRQIVLNLLANAIKFTNEGGALTVSCDADDRWARIHVTDTGIGIPGDRLKAIFEPFVQVNRTLTHPTEGTGLGLAISRDLARGMGGEISVESTLGAGSSFVLALPRAT
jgi:signal transduction histidine kinase